MAQPLQFTTPTGRMIGGSLYEPEITDYEGKPLVVKTGANAGQPTQRYNVGIAIPKTSGVTHWASETWGRPIWDLANAAFTAGETQRHDFAWKITDGDSTVPGKPRNGQPGKRPCDRQGYPGHWVIWMSSAQAPRTARLDNGQPAYLMDKDAIKPGYYVQILCNVNDNKPSPTPGMYWNPSIVCLIGYGPEITQGPSLSDAAFTAALPPGASATPVGVATLSAPQPPAPLGTTVGYVPPGPGTVVAPQSPVPVHPAPGFVQVPPPPAAVVAPPAPAAPSGLPPGRIWLNPTHTYAQFKADPQWTDDLLVAQGHMR